MTEDKSEGAFRTIGELSAELGVPQHILRYWETRFPQLRPLTRAGNRRYYRPEDVALARRIHQSLNQEGFTIKGVQRLLAGAHSDTGPHRDEPKLTERQLSPDIIMSLTRIRDQLAAALIN